MYISRISKTYVTTKIINTLNRPEYVQIINTLNRPEYVQIINTLNRPEYVHKFNISVFMIFFQEFICIVLNLRFLN